jgi:methyl-accepting chemotaxis protein
VQLFLSWKQKFRLLIAITLFSLAAMTASSYWAGQRLNEAQHARENATAYSATAITLMNHWLKLGAARKALTPETEADFQSGLGALQERSQRFAAQAQGLGDTAIEQSAAQIDQLIQDEIALEKKWLELSRQLGLTPFQGQRASLAASSTELESINLGLIRDYIAAAVSNQRDYLATFNVAFAQKVHAAIKEMDAKIEELDWRENKVGQAVAAFAQEFTKTDALILQIYEIEQQLERLGQQIEQRIDEQNLMLEEGILVSTAQQAEQARSTARWMMGLTFVGVSLFMLITLSQASRTLMAQLHDVIELLSKVATGNLTTKLAIGRNPNDEFNQLGAASNQMTDGIANVIRQVVDGNHHLTELHTYLCEAMTRMGENSNQVEMQTEQAASASQQISATVNEMARQTTEVGNSTQTACNSARTGAKVIGDSVASMRNLSQLIQTTHAQVTLLTQSSTKVTGIIDVINSLAAQTNLLALNAAIEAARAGEAGRGFSVVADEVRSLAQKTVTATTDIASIVDDLRNQTERMDQLMLSGLTLASEGERHAGEAAVAIDDITQSMEHLTAEMHQVVVAIEEISATTEDIARKIEDINVHTGETKSLRLTLEEHTKGLSVQVQALNHSAEQFRIA